MRIDHDRHTTGLWRIIILQWRVSLHGYRVWKNGTYKVEIFLGHIKEKVKQLISLKWSTNRWGPCSSSIYLWEVSIENLRREWHADMGRLPLRTTSPVLFGTCIFMFYLLCPILFTNLSFVLFRTIHFEKPSVLSRFSWKCKAKNIFFKLMSLEWQEFTRRNVW